MDSDKSQAKDDQSKEKLFYDNLPMLLVPNGEKGSRGWSIYDISVNKFIAKPVLPSYDKRFTGSSEGWLATIDENYVLTLRKPFIVSEENIDNIITLPHLCPPVRLCETYHEHYIHKFTTFTPDPIENPNDIICMVVFGYKRELFFIRPAQYNRWKRVRYREQISFADVVYHNDQFYALTRLGKLASFEDTPSFISHIKFVIDDIPDIGKEYDYCCKKYLTKSHEGEFLQVLRYLYEENDQVIRKTKKFRVFKLDSNGSNWVEIKSLGDAALFLGDNSSISILASNIAGCEKSCIYFTHDKDDYLPFESYGLKDIGVYNLESGSITGFAIDEEMISKMYSRTPIWVLP